MFLKKRSASRSPRLAGSGGKSRATRQPRGPVDTCVLNAGKPSSPRASRRPDRLGGEVRGPHSRNVKLPPDISTFLADHPPFQSMMPSELDELAAASSTHRFSTGAVIADYTSHVPHEIWMVCTEQVILLHTGDDSVSGVPIDTCPRVGSSILSPAHRR